MRRLSVREKRLVFALCAVAVLGASSYYMAPQQGPDPEEVIAFYVTAFRTAEKVTIRAPDGKMNPVILTREKDGKLMRRLESAVTMGGVTFQRTPQPPRYVLDLSGRDGSETRDISVGFTLDCPKQPAHGKLALVPREPGVEGPVPVMALMIEDHLDPAGAKTRHEKIREQLKQFTSRGRGMRGGDGRAGAPGAGDRGSRRGGAPAPVTRGRERGGLR